MTENPTGGTPVPPTNPATTTPAPMVDQPSDTEPTHDGGVAAEERRQEELAEQRQVHADRGSEPDAQQRISAEHEGTGPGNLDDLPESELGDGSDNA